MHDFVRGAFQALSWARMLIGDVENLGDLKRVAREIDDAIEDIKQGVAVDFRRRLRLQKL